MKPQRRPNSISPFVLPIYFNRGNRYPSCPHIRKCSYLAGENCILTENENNCKQSVQNVNSGEFRYLIAWLNFFSAQSRMEFMYESDIKLFNQIKGLIFFVVVANFVYLETDFFQYFCNIYAQHLAMSIKLRLDMQMKTSSFAYWFAMSTPNTKMWIISVRNHKRPCVPIDE